MYGLGIFDLSTPPDVLVVIVGEEEEARGVEVDVDEDAISDGDEAMVVVVVVGKEIGAVDVAVAMVGDIRVVLVLGCAK